MKSVSRFLLTGTAAAGFAGLTAVTPWCAVPAVLSVGLCVSMGLRFARQSLHDPLTGLPNRRALEDSRAALSPIENISLLFLDVNDLHTLNRVKGHAAGDWLLCAAADGLRRIPNSKAFRIGGDEFLLLSRSASAADLLAQWSATESAGSVAAGAASGPASDWAHLLQQAEQAMYLQKDNR